MAAIAKERVVRLLSGGPGSKLVANILVNEALVYTRARYGIDLKNANTAEAILHVRIPILLILGLADHETSPENSRQIVKANTECVTLWYVPGTGHTGAYATAPGDFEQKVLNCFRYATALGKQ